MKKRNIILSRLSAGALSAILLCGGIFAGATVASKTVTAQYNDVKIVVNGIEITPKDADGNTVEPFIVDGTTYLPVRAIANALGLAVAWDGPTKTAYLGDIPGQETNWMTKLPPYQLSNVNRNVATSYDGSDARSFFTVSGQNHLSGVTFEVTNSLHKYDCYALWNTNTLYKTMTFTVGSLDGNQHNADLEIYLNGEYSNTYEVKWDYPPQTITIPLNYASNIKLEFKDSNSGPTGYAIYDISFAE